MFKRWYIRWRNKQSAKQFSWHPAWFRATKFDDHLTKRIESFQKRHNLKTDGICAAATYKMLILKRHHFRKKIKTKKTNYNNG